MNPNANINFEHQIGIYMAQRWFEENESRMRKRLSGMLADGMTLGFDDFLESFEIDTLSEQTISMHISQDLSYIRGAEDGFLDTLEMFFHAILHEEIEKIKEEDNDQLKLEAQYFKDVI